MTKRSPQSVANYRATHKAKNKANEIMFVQARLTRKQQLLLAKEANAICGSNETQPAVLLRMLLVSVLENTQFKMFNAVHRLEKGEYQIQGLDHSVNASGMLEGLAFADKNIADFYAEIQALCEFFDKNGTRAINQKEFQGILAAGSSIADSWAEKWKNPQPAQISIDELLEDAF